MSFLLLKLKRLSENSFFTARGRKVKKMKSRLLNTLLFIVFLAVFLYPQEALIPKRTLDVKLVLDKSCAGKDKLPLFKKIIADVSRDFEEQFALAFSVKTSEIWKNTYKKKSLASLIQLFYNNVAKGDADIVIGFVSPRDLQGKKSYGVSFYEEGYILLRCIDKISFLEKVLKHEIAHLFGAAHVSDSNSLMHHFIRGDRLDGKNKAIIKLQRERKFKVSGFPLSAEICEKVVPFYEKIAHANEALKGSLIPFLQKKALKSGLLSDHFPTGRSEEIRTAYKGLDNVYTYLAMIYIHLGKYNLAVTYYLLKDFKTAGKHLGEAEGCGIKVDEKFKQALKKALEEDK